MKKSEVNKYQMEQAHPAIPDAYEKLQEGRITRREFLRLSTLLGMSAGMATLAAGLPAKPAFAAPAHAVKRGGTWTCSMQLQLLDTALSTRGGVLPGAAKGSQISVMLFRFNLI